LTHPPDIILIFDIVITHNGDEPFKDNNGCLSGRTQNILDEHVTQLSLTTTSRSIGGAEVHIRLFLPSTLDFSGKHNVPAAQPSQRISVGTEQTW